MHVAMTFLRVSFLSIFRALEALREGMEGQTWVPEGPPRLDLIENIRTLAPL
jgi:hypothetical protein